MAKYLKKTTNITGLPVSKTPHHTLLVLYGKILRTLQKMPENSVYRKHTEKLICEREDVIKQIENVLDCEKKIGMGQIEEVILQAENELLLARKMLQWKPWEPLIREAPPNQWTWPPIKP